MSGVTRGSIRIGLATAGWCAAHSLLASRPAKEAAERFLGTRTRNGLYRGGFNLVALVTFALLVRYVRRQPGRTLYEVRGPGALFMRAGQAASLLYAIWGVFQVGVGGMSGLPNLLAWLTSNGRVPREPEGQTPAPHRMTCEGGTSTAAGSPFALTRQAVNFFLLPLLWLAPRMTSRLAAFNVVATVYLYLGSLHTERRLRRAYGHAYDEAYQGMGVPFFLPRLSRSRAARLTAAGAKTLYLGAVE